MLVNNFDFLNLSSSFLILVGMMLIVYYPAFWSARKIFLAIWDKFFLRGDSASAFKKLEIAYYIKHGFASTYLIVCWQILFHSGFLHTMVEHVIFVFSSIYSTVFLCGFLSKMVDIVAEIYSTKYKSTKLPIELHQQILKIIIIICASLIIASRLLGVSLSGLFTSLGAAAAVLTFIFKDTATNLIASMQITMEDVIKIDDRIMIPSMNIDGMVETISITVLKIRNFDNSISIIPTSSLLTTCVRNLRDIKKFSAKLIKKSVLLDMKTIKLCSQDMLDSYKDLELLKEVYKTNPQLFDASSGVTNTKIFRHYVLEYIKINPNLHKENFLFFVRFLDPTADGLPLEFYAFSKKTETLEYQEVQSELIEHVVTFAPKFGLHIFQNLT